MAVKKSKFSETQVGQPGRKRRSNVDALDRRSIEDGGDHPLSVGKPPVTTGS